MTDEHNAQTATDVQGFASDYYLKIKGVDGECSTHLREAGSGLATGRRPHQGIEILSFSWGLTQR